MRGENHGFSAILIVVLVFSALVAGGGVYYLAKGKFFSSSSSPTTTNGPILPYSSPSSTPTPVINTSSPQIVTGKVLIYRMDDKNMTVQLIAQSSQGNVTEAMVWTDSNPTKKWQEFTTLLTIPISDYVYAQYKDNLGNVSEVYSDTINPPIGPPNQ